MPSAPAAPSASPAAPAPALGLLRVLGFFSGGSVMMVEFAGNRLLAPGFGNSLYTWTALIGVILLAASCGDYLGGWLVDRAPRRGLLPLLFALGGALTAAIPLAAQALPDLSRIDLVWGPIEISLLLFFLPAVPLAAITPVCIRLLSQVQADTKIGKSAGTVGMAAALGSMAGTLGASYVLIPAMGVRQILLLLGALLIVIALVLFLLWRRDFARGFAGIAAAGALAVGADLRAPALPPGVIYQKETFYHRIVVADVPSEAGPARLLRLDSTDEGAQVLGTGELVFPYQHYWRLAEALCPKMDHALFLGAGAFGMPEQLSRRYPDAAVDVVEIDPRVIQVGRRFFDLDRYPEVHPAAGDARRFLQRSALRYDFIFGDAYHGVECIPAHLVTREFFAAVGARLTGRGVFMMNLIGSVQGDKSRFFWRVWNSLRPTFPHLQVYGESDDPNTLQNLILVASRADLDAAVERFRLQGAAASADPMLPALLASRLDLPPPPSALCFTDNFDPAEYVIARQLRSEAAEARD